MSHKGNDYLVDNLLDREMKKPEKKKLCSCYCTCCNSIVCNHKGYKQAIDDYEAYLPDNKDIESLVQSTIFKWNRLPSEKRLSLRIVLAKAISKRIRGVNNGLKKKNN